VKKSADRTARLDSRKINSVILHGPSISIDPVVTRSSHGSVSIKDNRQVGNSREVEARFLDYPDSWEDSSKQSQEDER